MKWNPNRESGPESGPDPEFTEDFPWRARTRAKKLESRNKKLKNLKFQRETSSPARAEISEGSWMPGFETTYRPRRFEEGWLLESLAGFFEEGLITDVLAEIKGGKEANVYLCRAHPEVGVDLLAAKVYRPRKFRNLRNDAMYREGREILNDEGGVVRRNDSRTMRAMKAKTKLGVQILHQSWILYEYGTLQKLQALDVPVPKPVSCGANAILMGFIGDAELAAPVLHSVRLSPEERLPLFRKVMKQIEVMLSENMIHGDLSPFNILYWNGDITLIDFPQVTMAHSNSSGHAIFCRDVLRVCEYFQKQGVDCDPTAIATRMWSDYLDQELRFSMR